MKEHVWEYCDHCKDNTVVCGACGNKLCSGTVGEIEGSDCSFCNDAYEIWVSGMIDKYE
jgi:hypothetical protein